MVPEPKLVEAPAKFWRVGRSQNPLAYTEIAPEDAASPRGGNRFDVPGGRVLYAATQPEGAFAETISRLRPSARMLSHQADPDEHLMATGSVPADWRNRRQIVSFELEAPLQFLDVDAPESHAFLTSAIPEQLDSLGVDNLDIAELRGKNRILTRLISLYIYTATDEHDNHKFSGIRYESRLGPWECWAIFDGSNIRSSTSSAISSRDGSLNSVAKQFGLTIH